LAARRWKSRSHDVIVDLMANHRDLAKELYASSLGQTSASRIWRTVVFAGAMLAAPLGTGCGSKPKPATTTPADNAGTSDSDKAAADKAAEDKAAADKAAADKAAADAAAEQAKKDEDERVAKEQAEKEAADKAAADAAAAEAAKRPRGGGKRPTGRGFVLA
jgi:hypothetical protein